MSTFHKNMPWGKGIWIWELQNCLTGNIPAIIQKMKDNDLQYAIIKSGDGPNTWVQFTKELVDAFHAAGLKIYSWSYVYGLEPVREGMIASYSLNLGSDGHVFDAESEFEQLPNPIQSAEQMLQAVRSLSPTAFIAHAPYPIIDYHLEFPYSTFGKYCDAVMPQVYQGDFKMTSGDAIIWMYDQWAKWQPQWPSECVKPIIPIAQAYDNYEIKPPYVLTPKDVSEFVVAAAGYKSVNFYEFAHILRDDCWTAIKEAKVTPPTAEDLGLSASPNLSQPVSSTTIPTMPAQNSQEMAKTETTPEMPVSQQASVSASSTPSTVVPASTEAKPVKLPLGTTVLAQKDIPVPSTIKVTTNPSAPGGIQMKVVPHKLHIEIVEEFLIALFSRLISMFKKGGGVK